MAVKSKKPQCPVCDSFKTLWRDTKPPENPGSSKCQPCGAVWKPDGTILSRGARVAKKEEDV